MKSNSPAEPLNCGKNEGTDFQSQYRRFYEYLKDKVVTCSMVTDATGIPQKNGTWYKYWLERDGLLAEVFTDKCKSTGFPAAYITTNKDLFPKFNQLNLFGHEGE